MDSWIKRRRSREERARKVVQGVRQGLKAGHLPDRKKRKSWKKTIRSPLARVRKLRQLGYIGRNPPRLIFAEQLGR
jgi:ribosomal protein L19E